MLSVCAYFNFQRNYFWKDVHHIISRIAKNTHTAPHTEALDKNDSVHKGYFDMDTKAKHTCIVSVYGREETTINGHIFDILLAQRRPTIRFFMTTVLVQMYTGCFSLQDIKVMKWIKVHQSIEKLVLAS